MAQKFWLFIYFSKNCPKKTRQKFGQSGHPVEKQGGVF
jgi:hypothetical protein